MGVFCAICVPGLCPPCHDVSRACSLSSGCPCKCSKFRPSCLQAEPNLTRQPFGIVWWVLVRVSVIYVLLSLLWELPPLYGVYLQWKEIPVASPRWWWIPFPCIPTIFITWSGEGFCLYSYHDMMYFNVVNIMIHTFLSASSASERKPRPTPTQGNLSCKHFSHFQANLFSQDEHKWMGPFFSDTKLQSDGCGVSTGCWRQAGVGSLPAGISAMLCLMMRTRWQSFPPISLSNFNLCFLCPLTQSRLDCAASN